MDTGDETKQQQKPHTTDIEKHLCLCWINGFLRKKKEKGSVELFSRQVMHPWHVTSDVMEVVSF